MSITHKHARYARRATFRFTTTWVNITRPRAHTGSCASRFGGNATSENNNNMRGPLLASITRRQDSNTKRLLHFHNRAREDDGANIAFKGHQCNKALFFSRAQSLSQSGDKPDIYFCCDYQAFSASVGTHSKNGKHGLRK